ncbi:MAG: chromate transporter [Bacteroidota bacterium]
MRAVFWLGITAFGGPQMHIPQFKRRLVDKHRFFDQDTLKDVNAFCSLLPGPSTTQTITVLGLKMGGPTLALLSLVAWSLPGAILMSIIALSPKFLGAGHLQFMQPMVAAFLAYSVISMAPWIRKSSLNYGIFIVLGILGFMINSPLLFPLGMVLAGILSAKFNKYELPLVSIQQPKPIRWRNLTAFGIIFLVVGGVGLALNNNAEYFQLAHPFVLFENTYRIGALSFGGGNTLAAMSHEQYVVYHHRLSPQEFNTGLGLLQALPGPNFNFMVYVNSMAMKSFGYNTIYQLMGCLIGLIAVFMPGTLMVFFAYPLWHRLQTHRSIRLALDGIFAAAVGFILTAALLINYYFWQQFIQFNQHVAMQVGVFAITLTLLCTKKVATPFIVLLMILMGWLIPM